MTEGLDAQIAGLKGMIDAFFEGMFQYAKLHPMIAVSIMSTYCDVIADIVVDAPLSEKQRLISEHFRNSGIRLDRLVTAAAVKDFAAPITNIFGDLGEILAKLGKP